MKERSKKTWEQTKTWCVENRELLMIGGEIMVGSIIGVTLARRYRKKQTVINVIPDTEIVERTKAVVVDESVRILTQLNDQPQGWMLLINKNDVNGNPSDLIEIARQIVDGEYGEV